MIELEIDRSGRLGVSFLHVCRWLLWSWMLWCLLWTTNCKPKMCLYWRSWWRLGRGISYQLKYGIEMTTVVWPPVSGFHSVPCACAHTQMHTLHTHTHFCQVSFSSLLIGVSVLHCSCTTELFTEYEMSASRPGEMCLFFCVALLGVASSSNLLCTWLG